MYVATTDWAQVAAMAEAATAGIAVFALIGAIVQLAQNRRHARVTRAYQYLERWNDPREIPLNAKLLDFIHIEPAEQPKKQKEWEAIGLEKRLEILHGLNFWEELAGMYRRRLVDRGIVRDYFGGPALAYRSWAEWFITDRRDKQHAEGLMDEFEKMCARILAARIRHERGRRAAAVKMTFPYARQWLRSTTRPAGASAKRP